MEHHRLDADREIDEGGEVKRLVLACLAAVALLVVPADGQMAAEVDRGAATPGGGKKLEARIPQLVAYQGKLTDSTGRPVDDGSYVILFSLSADSIGASFWRETQTVTTQGGLFNVLLGSNVPISADDVPHGGCFLGIRVLPSAQEFRRQRIVSVPFAFQADNADRLQGRDSAALDDVYVSHADTNAVTSALIEDGTISRVDVAPGFTAPYADTADYARLASDSARVAADAHTLQGRDTTALWNAKTLQGKDTVQLDASYVNEGQPASIAGPMIGDTAVGALHIRDGAVTSGKIAAGAVGSAEIADSSVTGTDIKDGTITSADIAASGVAAGTYGDGYHVARITVDATGRLTAVADTTILGAAPSGPAGGDLFGNYPNPAIAANAVTSAKILDSTVSRTDVAPGFKAPFSDTADYAYAAPASDSARVAGNSHLLQNKDTTALWNAKTLQGKDTTDLWDAKTLQGKDTTALDARYVDEGQAAGGDLAGNYPDPTIAANAVTLAKVARGSTSGQAIIAQGSGTDPVWGYPNAVGASGTPVSFIRTDTFTLDLDSIAADSVYQATVYIPGLLIGDRVFLSHPTTGDNWQYIQGLGNCAVPADDSLAFRVWNSSAGTQDPGAATWRYIWIRPQ
jgi:hypothetical protein